MDGIYKHYVIDLSCNNNFVQVPTVQGDGNNVRGFEVELISNNVQYIVDAENTIVSIAGTKPDTKQILNSCEVTEEGYILVDITNQMSAVAGRGDYSITLMDKNTNALLQSFPFYILTTKSAFDATEITSSNEFRLLTESTVRCQAATEDAIEATEDMRQLEADVRVAEDARVIAENARDVAEQAREVAEQQREADTDAMIQNANQAIADAIKKVNDDAAVAIQNTNQATADAIVATQNANQATNDTLDAIADAQIATADTITATQNANTATTNATTATTNAIDATNRVAALEQSFTNAEATRVQNEDDRIANEIQRQQDSQAAINGLGTAIADTNTATNRANAISSTLEQKLANGDFNGKDGKDGADGKDGVIMSIDANQYYFSIVDGDLILTYNDGT